MNIEITFINHSEDTNSPSIVIFQKNKATDSNEPTVAWRVIEKCGINWSHKFSYPLDFSVSTADSYGNIFELQTAFYGQKWDIQESHSGVSLDLSSDPSSAPTEVEIKNSLSNHSMDAQIYRDGNLLATQTISPQQKAVFEFEPILHVGVVDQLEEGDVINSDLLANITQQFSLLGITKADLIMTGGGTGADATPFKFELVPTS